MKALVVSSLILCGLIVVGTAHSAEAWSPPLLISKNPVVSQVQSVMNSQNPVYITSEDEANLGDNSPAIDEGSAVENDSQAFVSC